MSVPLKKGGTVEWRDLIIDGYGRSYSRVEEVLKELTTDDLQQQPRPDCNSLGWTSWHLTRVQDAEISGLMKEQQLWVAAGWHAKFQRPANPEDTGYGHTPDAIAAFKSPDPEMLLAYHRAVLERSKGYIATLPESELGRELDEPWFTPKPTVGVRLVSVMTDGMEHAGEMAYLRGLLKGAGWSY